jgi:hypothetical protein
MLRRSALSLLSALFIGGLAGMWTAVSPEGVPLVHAACGVAPGACLTQNSSMAGVDVYHASSLTLGRDVEPDDTDSWRITATHSTEDGAMPPSCECEDYTTSVTADVSWTGTGGRSPARAVAEIS